MLAYFLWGAAVGQIVVPRVTRYGNDSAQAPFRTLSSTEQSENVYENKGSAWKSGEQSQNVYENKGG